MRGSLPLSEPWQTDSPSSAPLPWLPPPILLPFHVAVAPLPFPFPTSPVLALFPTSPSPSLSPSVPALVSLSQLSSHSSHVPSLHVAWHARPHVRPPPLPSLRAVPPLYPARCRRRPWEFQRGARTKRWEAVGAAPSARENRRTRAAARVNAWVALYIGIRKFRDEIKEKGSVCQRPVTRKAYQNERGRVTQAPAVVGAVMGTGIGITRRRRERSGYSWTTGVSGLDAW